MSRTRWFVTGAAAVAVVLGGGAALAAGGSSDPASDFLGDVAERLGISEGKLENAIEDATIARIDADVAAGRISKEEGEALKERVRSGEGPAIVPGLPGPDLGPGPAWPLERGFVPGFPGEDPLEAAADYLGVDAAEVREALRDGTSLAGLARDKGKSVEGLKKALRDGIRKDANWAVEHGLLTREQADRLVEKFGNAVDMFVEGGLRSGLDFKFEGGGFGLHLQIAPDGPVPAPRGPNGSSFAPTIIPPQPI